MRFGEVESADRLMAKDVVYDLNEERIQNE